MIIQGAASWSSASSDHRPSTSKPKSTSHKRSTVVIPDNDSQDVYELSESDQFSGSSTSSTPSLELIYRHRETCDKCNRLPAKVLCKDAIRREENRKKKGGAKRKRKDEEFLEDEVDTAEALGGWLECTKCCSSYHWVSNALLRTA